MTYVLKIVKLADCYHPHAYKQVDRDSAIVPSHDT